MSKPVPFASFTPNPPDSAGVLTWVHIGDLHMTVPGEQNDLDLQAIIGDLNAVFRGSASFVYLPGDVAEHGNRDSYAIVRASLDRLQLPWCAIIGDHDVHEKTFQPFLEFISAPSDASTYYAFTVGNTRFIALNAFEIPEPPSFTLLPGQLQWLEEQLTEATSLNLTKVLLLHCYPSDLKTGGSELIALIRKHNVTCIDMGHTHYNEIANDGRTIYTAARSTGQIEEGPVGFSVTNLDNGNLSWRFLPLGELPAVIITSPADLRLVTESTSSTASESQSLRIRAKVFSRAQITSVHASLSHLSIPLENIPGSSVYEATLSTTDLPGGLYPLHVRVEDANGKSDSDSIRISIGATLPPPAPRHERDQDNAIGAWPQHGILGTQLGPNKSGRKW